MTETSKVEVAPQTLLLHGSSILTTLRQVYETRDVSKKLMKLLKKMMHPNPDKRPSAKKLLKNSWVKEEQDKRKKVKANHKVETGESVIQSIEAQSKQLPQEPEVLKDGTLECSPIIMTFDESFEKKEGVKYVVTFSSRAILRGK